MRMRLEIHLHKSGRIYSASLVPLAIMSALLLLFLSSLLVLVRSQTAPYITFMGQTYSSYSCIDLQLVGEEENDGVHCNTDLHSCCTLGYDSGDWYPPGSSSSLPSYSEAVYIYQERESRRVSLYRRDLDSAGEAGEGVYECDIETVATNMNGGSVRATAYVELKTGGCEYHSYSYTHFLSLVYSYI